MFKHKFKHTFKSLEEAIYPAGFMTFFKAIIVFFIIAATGL